MRSRPFHLGLLVGSLRIQFTASNARFVVAIWRVILCVNEVPEFECCLLGWSERC